MKLTRNVCFGTSSKDATSKCGLAELDMINFEDFREAERKCRKELGRPVMRT